MSNQNQTVQLPTGTAMDARNILASLAGHPRLTNDIEEELSAAGFDGTGLVTYTLSQVQASLDEADKLRSEPSPGVWTRVNLAVFPEGTKSDQIVATGRGVMRILHDGSPEAEANVALILAAPRMLALLKNSAPSLMRLIVEYAHEDESPNEVVATLAAIEALISELQPKGR
jgi:hypothetical protein